MSTVTLHVQRRETGKVAAKATRKQGLVNAVFYGDGADSIPLKVNPKELRQLVYTPKTHLISLAIDGEENRECLIKDIAFDPVSDEIMHVDFMHIRQDKPIKVMIPINLKGPSKGILEGGKLNQSLKRLTVSCLPKHLPEELEVDIRNMGQGDKVRIRHLAFENITLLQPKDTLVVGVKAKR